MGIGFSERRALDDVCTKKPAQSWSWPDDAAARTIVLRTCASRRPIASRVRWVKITATTRSNATTAACRGRVLSRARVSSARVFSGHNRRSQRRCEGRGQGRGVSLRVVQSVFISFVSGLGRLLNMKERSLESYSKLRRPILNGQRGLSSIGLCDETRTHRFWQLWEAAQARKADHTRSYTLHF